MIEGGGEVVLLTAALVERAGRGADAAEIEPECREPRLLAHFGRTDHDRVFHVAAVERMRVTQSDPAPRADRDCQPGAEGDTGRDGKGHESLGYHVRMRITAGWWAVQPTC